MIKAILFDCFGVLTRDKWREYVLSLPTELQQAVHDLNHERGIGKMSREEFIQRLVTVTGRDKQEIAEVTTPGDTKNNELLQYIRTLKQNYKIGLISNVGSNWIREQFLSPDEQNLFDDFLLSYEVNMIKPDPDFYALAAKRLGVAIGECLLVDDIERYCAAARQQGMKAVVYHSLNQLKQDLTLALSQK